MPRILLSARCSPGFRRTLFGVRNGVCGVPVVADCTGEENTPPPPAAVLQREGGGGINGGLRCLSAPARRGGRGRAVLGVEVATATDDAAGWGASTGVTPAGDRNFTAFRACEDKKSDCVSANQRRLLRDIIGNKYNPKDFRWF